MKRLWRICDARYSESALSDEGAFRYPGRWNVRGVPMIYSATSPALAMLEYLVNIDREEAPDSLVLLELKIPGTVPNIPDGDLPADWNALPSPESTQVYGTTWARSGSSLALAVPSIVLPTRAEMTVLLNPLHKSMKRVERLEVTSFSFDTRLLD